MATKEKRAKNKPPATKLPKLARWKKVAFDSDDSDESESSARYDLLEATNDSVDYEDLFGDVPEHVMVHEGSVSADGLVSLRGWDAREGSQQTLYVIEGDLTINGTLVFAQSDICTTLWVKGTLRAQRVALASSAVLIVGALIVDDVLLTNLEDAGHLIVHGPCEARVWLDLWFRGSIELDELPKGCYRSDDEREKHGGDEGPFLRGAWGQEPLTSALDPALLEDGTPSYRKLVDALCTGTTVLR